jgi:hypothetical protein
MLYVFILNLLVFRALRGHHMDHSEGLERQGNSARIFLLATCWRRSGDDGGGDGGGDGPTGAIMGKNGMPPHTAAHDFIRRLTTPKSFKRRQKTS